MVFYTWTEWSLYLLPELQAASPVLTWWAKRTQLAFLKGVQISIWSSIWWSTTLATRNMLSCYILCHIDTHYYILLHIWGFKLDFIAEGDIGALKVQRLVLAINLDRNSKKELQPSVPDVIRAQYEAFHPGGASKDEILSVVPIICFVWERPAMKTLVPLVYCVTYLQCPVDPDVSLSQNGSANLQQSPCYCTLSHVNTH